MKILYIKITIAQSVFSLISISTRYSAKILISNKTNYNNYVMLKQAYAVQQTSLNELGPLFYKNGRLCGRESDNLAKIL